ncbi:hypothetical protein [Hyphomicrobium sp. 99]|uniref:hypothetical protein n=1 Tax=Hyphomicrobium sp. 99 TaxID=1163419 RepID=UPI0012E043CD|nr:hypothetical protein [Hyphomicrobium sp. 99]
MGVAEDEPLIAPTDDRPVVDVTPENADRKVAVEVGSAMMEGYRLGDRAEGAEGVVVAVGRSSALSATPDAAGGGDDSTSPLKIDTFELDGSIKTCNELRADGSTLSASVAVGLTAPGTAELDCTVVILFGAVGVSGLVVGVVTGDAPDGVLTISCAKTAEEAPKMRAVERAIKIFVMAFNPTCPVIM